MEERMRGQGRAREGEGVSKGRRGRGRGGVRGRVKGEEIRRGKGRLGGQEGGTTVARGRELGKERVVRVAMIYLGGNRRDVAALVAERAPPDKRRPESGVDDEVLLQVVPRSARVVEVQEGAREEGPAGGAGAPLHEAAGGDEEGKKPDVVCDVRGRDRLEDSPVEAHVLIEAASSMPGGSGNEHRSVESEQTEHLE